MLKSQLSSKQLNNLANDSDILEYDDGRTYNPKAVRVITQEWVDKHMKDREAQFTETINNNIFCGTWNVNAKKEEMDLHDWLLPKDENNKTNVSDIYAIGFQEMVDLNAMNVALDSSKSQNRSQFWQDKIMECLSSTGIKFSFIMGKHLVGLYLCICAKESLVKDIHDVRATSAGVGIMGMLGNKGGVSIRMSIYDSSVCFVCSHLAAHRGAVTSRNEDFKNIIEKSLFETEEEEEIIHHHSNKINNNFNNNNNSKVNHDTTSDNAINNNQIDNDVVRDNVVRPRNGAEKTKGEDLTIMDHELIFWLGDLNYRIDEEISLEEVYANIATRDLAFLRSKDQLNIEREKNTVFQNFHEGILEFTPTYKYRPGTDIYDQRPDKKMRAPAWCDRILWYCNGDQVGTANSVRQLGYRKCDTLLSSDHKAVSAAFNCDLRVVVVAKETAVYQDLMNTLEYWNNSEIPDIELSSVVVDFDRVKYQIETKSTIQIKNIGATIAHWHFVPKVEDVRISKRWVSVSCVRGLLLPNEVAEIIISVTVDKKTAQSINLGKETLDDILILRVENCVDKNIVIMASYERSCYGMSLEELVSIPIPVRATKLPSISSNVSADGDKIVQANESVYDSSGQLSKLSIPKELWRLIDALWTGGGALKEKDIFSVLLSNPIEVAAIRESLDCGTEFPICSPHSIAEALVSFIDALPRPLLPTELYPSELEKDKQNIRVWARKFLENLPPLHYNVFVYILSFLREVLELREYNRSTNVMLSAIFVAVMTPSSTDLDCPAIEREKRALKQEIMQQVISFFLMTKSI